MEVYADYYHTCRVYMAECLKTKSWIQCESIEEEFNI